MFPEWGPSSSDSHRAVSLAAAALSVLLAAIVFYIDTFAATESAVAVLYGLAILLAAEVLSSSGIVVVAGACCAATAFSYMMSRLVRDHGSAAPIRRVAFRRGDDDLQGQISLL